MVPDWVQVLDGYGSRGEACFFLIDFEMQQVVIRPLDEVGELAYDFNGRIGGRAISENPISEIKIDAFPIDYRNYLGQFMTIQQHIKYGNTFLINLTHKTPIQINYSLKEVYQKTSARYKLWFEDKFVMFSPESFVQIHENRISTFPMKGTIDAQIPNAVQIILDDVKESAEHYTIVDLLRNDLSKIARKVQVDKFRYVDEIQTHSGKLLQVSSSITGMMAEGWESRMGSLLHQLLPAGSISGAPKDKTAEIISEVEVIPRGYYTGITGIFDGHNLDSGVCIRFIEKEGEDCFFRSGCGITNLSSPQMEYEEMIKKIYVPAG